jgi:hypothetical protein
MVAPVPTVSLLLAPETIVMNGSPRSSVICVRVLWLAFMAGVLAGRSVRADVVTFEDLSVPPAGYFNGDPGGLSPGGSVSDPWSSGGVEFSNTFGIDADYVFPYWFGFAYSDVVNTTDPDFTNQYASYPGGGFGSSTTYAVVYASGATVSLPSAATVSGFRIANTTYAALTMINGDAYGFSLPLGPGGWFRVTATGSLGGSPTGSAEYYLADLRGASPPGVLATWDWFDLSPLGAVDSIGFAFTGSDNGAFGLNTPAYFAMDDLTFAPVPEPSVTAILVSLVATGAVARRSRRRAA